MSEMDIRPDDLDDVLNSGAGGIDTTGFDIEASEADAVEQRQLVGGLDERRNELPFEVDPADAAEQARVVELDEDDYR